MAEIIPKVDGCGAASEDLAEWLYDRYGWNITEARRLAESCARIQRTETRRSLKVSVCFEIDADGQCTGGVHFYCSQECREVAPKGDWNIAYVYGEQPLSDIEPETVCEACGKFVTPPAEIERLKEFVR